MPQDDPLWYDRVEAGEPDGPILSALAVAFVALGYVWLLPSTFWTLAGRFVSPRG